MPAWAITTVLCVSGTVVALQQTLVVPLLPDFPTILHASADNVSWLVTATLLTGAVATPIVSRLADMVGKRRMMLVSMLAMVAGSILAASAASLVPLVAGRALQGFASALIPVGISILRDELPRERVSGAVALMSATLGIGAAIGLPLSGVIYAHLGWHAIFWLSAAAGIILIVAVLAVVPESSVRTRGSFDYVGALLLSGALTSLLLAITKGGTWGWNSENTLLLFISAAVLLVIWVPFELRVGSPLVDIRTSARKSVLLTNVASVMVGFAMYCNNLATTQQLQMPKISGYGFQLSVIAAGLGMLPAGLAMVALAPVSAAITKRHGAKATLITGALVLATGYVGRVFLTGSVWQVVFGATVVSMGTAITYAAMPTLIMRAVPITETAAANGLNTLLRALGTSTASAMVAVILTSTVVQHGPVALPSLDAFKHIFWAAALAALVAAVVALALPRPRSTLSTAGVATAGTPHISRGQIEEIKAEGHEHEIVVRGTVLREDLRPVRHAVVSVMRSDGEPVDWSRVDNEGVYSIVLPGPGRYVVVSSADGWAPRSDVFDFTDADTLQHVRLAERLSLSGVVTRSGEPMTSAMLWLTRPTGESVGTARTDASGHYLFPLPAPGWYILTAVDPDSDHAQSHQFLMGAQSTTLNFETASVPQAVSRS